MRPGRGPLRVASARGGSLNVFGRLYASCLSVEKPSLCFFPTLGGSD